MLVLRDVEDGKLEALERRAKESVEALWRDVDKPERLACLEYRLRFF